MTDPHTDDGTSPALLAIRGALHTNRHAQMCFDMVVDLLGPAAHVETRSAGTLQTLYRTDPAAPDLLLPWPLLTMSRVGRVGTVVNLTGPDGEPLPRPGRVPRLRGLGPGEIILHDGRRSITVTYGEDGRWKETTRARDPRVLEAVVPAMEQGSDSPVHRLSRFLAGLDIERHGAGRVLLPEALPAGVGGAWRIGLEALRRAFWSGRLGPGPGWVIADGYAGSVLSRGPTAKDALVAWRSDVERMKPQPPAPVALPPSGPDFVHRIEGPDGAIGFEARITRPKADIETPAPTPANTPAVLVHLPEPPVRSAPLGTWITCVDRHGRVVPTARRDDDGGFTLVAEALLDTIDLATLDHVVDDLAARQSYPAAHLRPPGMPPPHSELLRVHVLDEDTLQPIPPRIVSSQRAEHFDPGPLDATDLAWAVLRQREIV